MGNKREHRCLGENCDADLSMRHPATKYCHDCAATRMYESNKKRNPYRVFVDGKYIKGGVTNV